MDFFTRTYTELQRNLEFAKNLEETEARSKARYFFSEILPDFYDMLINEGYEVEGGKVEDWQEEGFPDCTCTEILIKKSGSCASIDLMRTKWWYADKQYSKDTYLHFLEGGNEEERATTSPHLSERVIHGISDVMVNFIGQAFSDHTSSDKPGVIYDSPSFEIAVPSMTRDELAALAMAGLLGNVEGSINKAGSIALSKEAYMVADAMIKVSKNGK